MDKGRDENRKSTRTKPKKEQLKQKAIVFGQTFNIDSAPGLQDLTTPPLLRLYKLSFFLERVHTLCISFNVINL